MTSQNPVYYISADNKKAIKNHLKNRFSDDELKDIEDMVKLIESKNLLGDD